MGKVVWLASYPKSGNTWTRVLISHALAPQDETITINTLGGTHKIASGRMVFDTHTLLCSGLMTQMQIEALRPAVHRASVAFMSRDGVQVREAEEASPFQKVHDAYTITASGEALLGGAGAASLAILIVRDPRAIAPSLASHLGVPIDRAIEHMADPGFEFSNARRDQPNQLRQKLLSWSDHTSGWRDQRDVPVHLVRYEDLSAKPVETLMAMLAVAGRPVARTVAEHAVAMSSFSRLTTQEAEAGFGEAPKGRTFFRKGLADSWQDELTEQQIGRIEKTHMKVMLSLGYGPVLQYTS